MDANRKTAYYVLREVEDNRAYSNVALNHYIKRIKPESSAFVRELVYGVLKHKLYLDYIITNFVKTPLKKLRKADLILLRMGLYQIISMDSVPEYAAVSETVNMAKRFSRGHESFINGVLRSYQRDKKYIELPSREEDEVGYLSVKYSYDPWIVEHWLDQYSESFVEELLAAGNRTPELTIRVNSLKTNRNDLMERISSRTFEVVKSELVSTALKVRGPGLLEGRLYRNGMFSVQDESSMMAIDMFDPQPGEVVLDVCAAPGGKTFAIAEKMRNEGEIIAMDVYKRKLGLMNKEADRLGIDIVEFQPWDATKIDSELIEYADKVLVDAPCTGLGTVRRKPEIKYKDFSKEMSSLNRKQLDILKASANYVRPGGILLYTTCSISDLENQKIVSDFLRRNKNFEKIETLQLFPNVNGTDGFFICKMKRREGLI